MTKEEVQKLEHGLYKITWKNRNGTSLAAVGSLANGDRWMAPCNWINDSLTHGDFWGNVKKIKLIKRVKH